MKIFGREFRNKPLLIAFSAILSASVVALIIAGSILGSRHSKPSDPPSDTPITPTQTRVLAVGGSLPFIEYGKSLFVWNSPKKPHLSNTERITALWTPGSARDDLFNFYVEQGFISAVVYAGCAQWEGAQYAKGEFPFGGEQNFIDTLELYRDKHMEINALVYLNDDYNDLTSNRAEMVQMAAYFNKFAKYGLNSLVLDIEPQTLNKPGQLDLFASLYADILAAAPDIKIIPTMKNAWFKCQNGDCVVDTLNSVGVKEYWLMAYSSDPKLVVWMAENARKYADNVNILIETDDIGDSSVSYHDKIVSDKQQFFDDYANMVSQIGPVSIHSYLGFLDISNN